MTAYFIVNLEVTSPRAFTEYSKKAPEIVSSYGGKYLVRGGEAELLEGAWQPKKVVILEFPSMARARKFYHSEDYKPLLALRAGSTHSEVVLVEGV